WRLYQSLCRDAADQARPRNRVHEPPARLGGPACFSPARKAVGRTWATPFTLAQRPSGGSTEAGFPGCDLRRRLSDWSELHRNPCVFVRRARTTELGVRNARLSPCIDDYNALCPGAQALCCNEPVSQIRIRLKIS